MAYVNYSPISLSPVANLIMLMLLFDIQMPFSSYFIAVSRHPTLHSRADVRIRTKPENHAIASCKVENAVLVNPYTGEASKGGAVGDAEVDGAVGADVVMLGGRGGSLQPVADVSVAVSRCRKPSRFNVCLR